ncbi:hypothetical protein PFLA_b0487 [Pseudoalteromonas flavipulchra NCIMB 2033 = ATCC BAA-314]|nr:hypothetical protein [Pseudoalteromonas flavipulchra NCIMB 2033 = ATCC BAA-314]
MGDDGKGVFVGGLLEVISVGVVSLVSLPHAVSTKHKIMLVSCFIIFISLRNVLGTS